MTLPACLLLGAALFCVGVFGALTRRDAIGILLSVEVMANAANLNLVAFSHFRGGAFGQVFTLFTIAITVAEVVVGLAIVILLRRGHDDVTVDQANDFKG